MKKLICGGDPLFLARMLCEFGVKRVSPDFVDLGKRENCRVEMGEVAAAFYSFGLIEKIPLGLQVFPEDFVWRTWTHAYCSYPVRDVVKTALLVIKRYAPQCPRDVREMILLEAATDSWLTHPKKSWPYQLWSFDRPFDMFKK